LLCFDIEYAASDFGFHTKDFDLHGCGFSTLCRDEIIAEYYTDRAIIQEIIDECFTMDIHCIAHYSQSDIAGLMSAGYKLPDNFLVEDTILLLSMLDENRQTYGLKAIARNMYNVDMEDYREAAKEGLSTERFYKYGKLDVMVELKIFCDHYDTLKDSPAFELYRELCKSVRTFADIMQVGMLWDVKVGYDLYLKIIPRIEEVEKRIYQTIGKINLASTPQLTNRLFRDLGYSTDGLPVSRKTGKVSLDKKAMAILAKKHKVCRDIVLWRSLKKVLSTYLTPYMEKMQNCGHVFGNYSLHSNTGRTRCSGENLQNVPTTFKNKSMEDLSLRSGFVARPGKKLIVSDFAGIELRVGATVCQEPFFQQAFRRYSCKVCGTEGESNIILHQCPDCGAAEDDKEGFWHGADLHNLTRDSIKQLNGDRSAAKAINFSIIYLAGPYKLHAEYPSISVDQWDDIIKAYLKKLPGVRRYHQTQEAIYKAGKESRDIFGRRRFVPLPRKTADPKKYKKEYKLGLNQIVNQPIQGPSAALIQIAQNDLRDVWLEKKWWKTQAMIINSVHDEIVTEVDIDLVDEAYKDLQFAMENCQRFLDVPLRAEPVICDSWAEAK
jgi:DNA polymerase I-like protein with 3'-5' exonuclease and polymerase domains